MARRSFDVSKFYCTVICKTHPRNAEKLNSKIVLLPWVFVYSKSYKLRISAGGNRYGPRSQFDFGIDPNFFFEFDRPDRSLWNSHNEINKCTNLKIILFSPQFVITPTCFDLSWSPSGNYWTSIKPTQQHRLIINPLNAELNPICYLLALLGAQHFLHVSRIRVKSLTLRQIMSYIYMEHLFLMFLGHTQRRATVGRTPPDEWSARRRDLYLTTHNTHNRQISMPPVGFEPTISAGQRPQAAHLLRSWVRIPPGHGYFSVVSVVCFQVEVSATSWSHVQRSPTECGASLCVI